MIDIDAFLAEGGVPPLNADDVAERMDTMDFDARAMQRRRLNGRRPGYADRLALARRADDVRAINHSLGVSIDDLRHASVAIRLQIEHAITERPAGLAAGPTAGPEPDADAIIDRLYDEMGLEEGVREALRRFHAERYGSRQSPWLQRCLQQFSSCINDLIERTAVADMLYRQSLFVAREVQKATRMIFVEERGHLSIDPADYFGRKPQHLPNDVLHELWNRTQLDIQTYKNLARDGRFTDRERSRCKAYLKYVIPLLSPIAEEEAPVPETDIGPLYKKRMALGAMEITLEDLVDRVPFL